MIELNIRQDFTQPSLQEPISVPEMIRKIQRLSNKSFSELAQLTLKHWAQELKSQSRIRTAAQITALPAYLGLAAMGIITSYASINLLYTADFSATFSSDVATRVTFANNITNTGALFACVTDLPAITYAVYLFLFRQAYNNAMCEALETSYRLAVDPDLSREGHEKLYQWHISQLQEFKCRYFYRNPDTQAPTGEIYAQLATTLEAIDQELEQGVSIRRFAQNFVEVLKKDSMGIKCAKVAACVISLFATTLSGFLILENGILLVDTPVNRLFWGSAAEQNNEAFYLTQLGSVFSAFTAIGAAGLLFRAIVQRAYEKTVTEQVDACFAKHTPAQLPPEERTALARIQKLKGGT